MATVKWAEDAESSNIAGTALNSLASTATSALMSWANPNRRALARVWVDLGSISPAGDRSITVIPIGGSTGGDQDNPTPFNLPFQRHHLSPTGAAAKRMCFIMPIPANMSGFRIYNGTLVTLNASGNAVYVTGMYQEVTA